MPYRIGIIGFGMAGATSAYLLARDGHAVTLLEKSDIVGPVGAGILLQASGQSVLKHLGILEKVLDHAAPLEELYARKLSGRTLIRTRFCDFAPGYHSYGVHRGVLFNALRELVNTQSIDIRLGSEIIGKEETADGVTLRDARGRSHGPFDFVLAGDGSRSSFREMCGFKASVKKYTHGTLWVNTPGSGLPGKLLQVVQGNRRLFGLLPLGDGLVSLYWGLPAREFEATRSRGLEALKKDILAFAPEAAPVLDYVFDIDQFLFTTYQHVHMRRWHDEGRVQFLGDSAHAMSPHLGQGVNLAMVDAWRLTKSLREQPTPELAFRAFRKAQRAYIRYYATVTYLLSPFFQSDWRILGCGRDCVLPWLPYVPFVKRQMLLTVCGLKGGFFKGKLEV